MSVASQGGLVSFAIQSAKVGKDGTFDPASESWFKMRLPRCNMGTSQNQANFPLELGGTLTPTGTYKAGYFFGGEVDFIPRLEDNAGWLFLAAMGNASSVADTDADANAVTGVNTHIFRHDPAEPGGQPWMALRRYIPGATTPENFGEIGFDCKVGLLRFTIPAQGKLAARLTVIGRDSQYSDASGWAYANANFEDFTTTPDSGRGKFLIGGSEYPITGATIDIINGLTGPQQEAIVGDFRMADIIALTRSAQINIVVKYANADLYRKMLTGSASGTVWDSIPYVDLTDCNNYAFDAQFEAPKEIASTGVQYGLRIRANKVAWAVNGPPELQAGGIIQQAYTGTVLQPDSGDYLQVVQVSDSAGPYSI